MGQIRTSRNQYLPSLMLKEIKLGMHLQTLGGQTDFYIL